MTMQPLPEIGPVCFADRQSILEYKAPTVSLKYLPGVFDVGLWTTDQMHYYGDACREEGAKAERERCARVCDDEARIRRETDMTPSLDDATIERLLPRVKHRPGMHGFECYSFGDVAHAVRAAIEQYARGDAEPVAWGQLGTMNGKLYLRENYDRTPYPPPPSIVRNANLVPLFARPSRPLTDEQIETLIDAACLANDGRPVHVSFARAIERAHGITAGSSGSSATDTAPEHPQGSA